MKVIGNLSLIIMSQNISHKSLRENNRVCFLLPAHDELRLVIFRECGL